MAKSEGNAGFENPLLSDKETSELKKLDAALRLSAEKKVFKVLPSLEMRAFGDYGNDARFQKTKIGDPNRFVRYHARAKNLGDILPAWEEFIDDRIKMMKLDKPGILWRFLPRVKKEDGFYFCGARMIFANGG